MNPWWVIFIFIMSFSFGFAVGVMWAAAKLYISDPVDNLCPHCGGLSRREGEKQ